MVLVMVVSPIVHLSADTVEVVRPREVKWLSVDMWLQTDADG